MDRRKFLSTSGMVIGAGAVQIVVPARTVYAATAASQLSNISSAAASSKLQISQTQKPFCSPGATRLSRHYLIMQNLKLNPGHLMDHFLPPASKNKIL